MTNYFYFQINVIQFTRNSILYLQTLGVKVGNFMNFKNKIIYTL